MRLNRGAALAAVVMVLGGCGDQAPAQPSEGSSDMGSLTSTDPVATGGLVWEADGVVHLADDTEIDLGGPPSSYVVAGDGVFFMAAETDEAAETGSTASGDIRFAAPDQEPVDTGLRLRADTLRSSPDGRFVAGIDVDSGEEDDFGTHLAQVVVLDLREGREVVRSSDGLGDLGHDLADLYEEVPVAIAAMTDETAYVEGVDGTFAVDVATGDIQDAHGTELPPPGSTDSPDGAWTLRNTDGVRAEIVGDHGEPVALDVDAPQWTLDWWADATTAVGVAITSDDSSSLLTCAVPDGSCEVIEASTGAMVRFPTGATDPSIVKLLGGEG
ncbi:hypothetical protein [Nocardioides astragali]|uniref:Uncharacterized protein n=1 Tax=Nocardioides astragali TaxID=1776736 RepID=A0ABW2MYH1_9ACTN|nr:hypothetical protein [Nocardioides astragali]